MKVAKLLVFVLLLSGVSVGDAVAGPLQIPEVQRRADKFGSQLRDVCTLLLSRDALEKNHAAVTDGEHDADLAPLSIGSEPEAVKTVAFLNRARAVCSVMQGDLSSIPSVQLDTLVRLRAHAAAVVALVQKIAADDATTAAGLFGGVAPTGTPQSDPFAAVATAESIGGKVLEGLGDFLVTRFKEEAADFLKRQIKGRVCGDANAKQLLTNLCAAFDDFDLSLSLNAMGTYLQAAARADLEALPENVLTLGAAGCPKSDDPCASAVAAARIGLAVFRAVRGGSDAIEVIRGIATMDELACETSDDHGSCAAFVKLLRKASLVVGAVDDLDLAGIVDLPRDVRVYYVVAAVLRARDLATTISATAADKVKAAADAVLADVASKLAELHAIVEELPALRASIQAIITEAQNAAASSGSTDELDAARWRAAATLAVSALRIVAREVAKDPTAKDAAPWLTAIADFGSALIERRFGDVTTQGLALLRRLHAALCEGKASCPKVEVPRAVMQVIPFMAEVVNADSSKEVAKAIEAAAAPVGAWRQKYKRRLVAINGMVGGAVGGERVVGVADSGAPLVSLFAPVGVHATAPKCDDHCEHFGVFLSVIDLGSYVSARLSSSSDVEDDSTVSVQQAFAPGLYLTVGLFDEAPIVIGVGGQYVPEARRVEVDGQTEDRGTLRLQAFVAMDIPIFVY